MNGSFWKKKKAGSVFLAMLLLTTLLAGCGINEGKAEKYGYHPVPALRGSAPGCGILLPWRLGPLPTGGVIYDI